MNRARAVKLLIGGLAVLILIQVIRPSRTNPQVVPSRSLEAHVPVPENVQAILKRACYDCHSSATVWPWYSQVAPVSWYVIHDVNAARGHINFQDWEAQENPKEGLEHLGLTCKEMREGKMPPSDYLLMHKDSRVSPDDINAVCAWAQKVAPDEGPEEGGDKGDHEHSGHEHGDHDHDHKN